MPLLDPDDLTEGQVVPLIRIRESDGRTEAWQGVVVTLDPSNQDPWKGAVSGDEREYIIPIEQKASPRKALKFMLPSSYGDTELEAFSRFSSTVRGVAWNGIIDAGTP